MMQDTSKLDKQRSASVQYPTSPLSTSPVSSSVFSQVYKSPTGTRHAITRVKKSKDKELHYSTPNIGYTAEAEFDTRARGESADLELPQWVIQNNDFVY